MANCTSKTIISKLNESGVAYKRNGGDSKLPGLLSLSFPGKDGEAILHRMDLMGISISTGSACHSVNTEISHVLQAIQLNEDYAKGTIRISLGKNNTEKEVERIAAALVKILL
ncbi:MAG: aminotransferase class V-fold PLP-dependent enzyme [Oscillospiraceae bacterium]|nr:aminotransferase class V-fold PLP-dependent enzyme [Oscillospiraceae bacterium]